MAEITPDEKQDIGQTGPSTDIQAPYPGATKVEDGVAYDASGKQLGPVDENTMKAPGAAPKPKWDPNAPMEFANQPKAAAKPKWNPNAPMQFNSEAAESTQAVTEAAKPDPKSGLWDHITAAVAGPNTALATPETKTQEQERTGLWDILTGDVKVGAKKIWDAEKIDANNIIPGSPAEWAIRQFDPDFHGMATKEAIAQRKAENPNAGEKPLIDIAQFVDMKKHPIAKALTEVAQGFTSPENIAIMYGTGGLGLIGKTPKAIAGFKVVNRLVSAGFSFQAMQGAYEHSKAFKEAFDAGDTERAEYELTHAVAAGVIAGQAGTHAAEGKYKVGGKTVEVKPMVEPSQTEKAVIGAISNVTKKAADATTNFAKEKLQGVTDRVGSAVGKTDDFDTAVGRVANMMGKKAGPEFQETVKTASDDLKAIANNDTADKIKDPQSWANAIDQHLQKNIEAPLLAEAGATRESTEPVVPDFGKRLSERLDKFFEDNAGEYGSNEQEQAIKQRIIDRLTRNHDLGNGVVLDRDPNLYEAEGARRGLNKSAGDVFENGTSSGYRAASADAANFMREVIDESYKAKGIQGVPEARAKEAALISIKEALQDAQGVYEKQQAVPMLDKLFSMGKIVGMVGAVGAHFLGSDVLGGALAAGTLWKSVHDHYAKDIESNVQRAKTLAAREPAATATTPQTGPTPPPQQGPAGTGPFTPRGTPEPGEDEPLLPNVPPKPQPPAPAERPETNHNLNGVLSSYFNELRGTRPYSELLDKFTSEFNQMKAQVFAAKHEGRELTEQQQKQWEKANLVNEKVNSELSKEDAAIEKENEKRQAAYQKELSKWNAKYQQEKTKAAEQKIANADAETQAKKQAEDARVAGILADERIAHSPLMKATEPATEIGGIEGRSSKQNHEHEHGHIVAATAEGLNPIAFISDKHPDAIEDNAIAQIHTDLSGVEKGGRGIEQRVIGMLGGPAWDEVHHGMKLSRNVGAGSDIAKAREILRDQAGLYGNRLDKVFDALYEKAKQHVSNPEAIALVQANAPLREAGLHENYHMSPGRMEEYVKKLQGVFKNGQTPTTEGVHEGDSDEGLPEGKSAESGASGEEQDGVAESPRAEAARESAESTAKESAEPVKFKGGTNAAGNEATARKATAEQKVQSLVDDNARLKELLRSNKGTPEQRDAALRRMEENNELMKEVGKEPEKASLKAAPPERSTGDRELDEKIKQGGAVPAGRMGPLAMFHHPETGSTLAMKPEDITPETVKEHLGHSTEAFTQGDIRNTAREYNAARGLPEVNPQPVTEDPRINKIADVYDKLEHAPNDPKVKASYDAFKKELDDQYDALVKSGFKFDTSKEDPYPSYEAMRKDILRNKHLTAWEGAAPPADHPLAERDPKTGMSYNEKFRLVHDVLGHAAHDADFSGHGEESAWNYHRQMFSPEAQPALAAETRGQVASFTKNGKFPDTQKAVLMPDEFNKRPEELPKTEEGIDKSSLSKDQAKKGLDEMRKSYGETDDASTVKDNHIFITPEGKFIDVGDHSDAIATHAKYNSGSRNGWDNRPEFINKSGAVRSYGYKTRAGESLSFSVPKDGVNEAQADAMRRAVKEGLSRNGNLIVERADVTGDTMGERSRKKDFPRDGDVDRMLREIGAHPGGNSVAAPVVGEKTRSEVQSANQAASAAAENANRQREAEYNKFYTPGGRLKMSLTADDIKPENLDIDLEKHPAGGIDPFTGSMDSKRYGVEIAPEQREVLDHKPTAADFHRFAVENIDTLKQHPDVKVGWDTLGGKPEMNIGVSTDDLDAAKRLGEKLDQRSVWDTQKQEEVPTGGKGEQREFPDYPMSARLADLDKSSLKKSPKGSSVPLMEEPLEIEGSGEKGRVSTLDVAQALNEYSKEKNPALKPGAEPEEMVKRAKKLAEDEAKYQMASGKTGTEWYTEEMKDHDKALIEGRPELATGEKLDIDTPWEHTAKMGIFKAVEAIMSSGQKPYGNFKAAVKAWDAYNETGEFPRVNPATGKSWGPRGEAAYGNAIDMVNQLIKDKGEKGAAEWLLSDHPVSELKQYKPEGVKGKATDMRPGAIILGEKRGPFMQNLHGIEAAFTADMWVSRTWNRWMGTMEFGKDKDGEIEIKSDSPRNGAERDLMKKSFAETAKKLGLSTSSLQAVLWYYEQALYTAHGVPKESWSFRDAAQRAMNEEKAVPQAEQTGFNFGENAKAQGGLSNLSNLPATKSKFVDLKKPIGGVEKMSLGQSPAVTYQTPKGWSETGPTSLPGMVKPGNINLTTRPVVKNDDGSHSSEYSVSFEDENGHEVLVPTVVDGKFLTPDGKKPEPGSPAEKAMYKAAWTNYKKTGQHLGIYDTPEHADAAANLIHNRPTAPK